MSLRGPVAAMTAVAVLLAGCDAGEPGGDVTTLSAPDVLERATAALAAAGSFRVRGMLQEGTLAVGYDLKRSGADSLGVFEDGETEFARLVIDGQEYFRLGEEFLATKIGVAEAHGYADRLPDSWVRYDSHRDDGLAKASSVFDVERWFTNGGRLTKSDPPAVGQQQVIKLYGVGDVADGGTLAVAIEGEPLPQELIPARGGHLWFSEFGADFPEVTAPGADEIIEIPV
ncbi:hypothetical protein [Actinoplanes awajinensis]|uniref:Lipoprotein n=1 Tax=Actinoplanes awajinensis subsp. mycoplanecinus TaxID=135947 RepID=A0A101JGF1_9ACTN|nr:hypothetical protein [Actinoplanes awajinensis]KUL26341.1 hypothetical protein ADL15_38795 [Actinoplanes awajinensis subsp. mycoplanecinus]